MNLGPLVHSSLCTGPVRVGRVEGLRAARDPLTVDEAQAGRIEQVFLQVVLTRAAVLPAQHLLPARHSPHERQVVTATVVAQQCLHLGGEAGARVTGQGPEEATSGPKGAEGRKGEQRATQRHWV